MTSQTITDEEFYRQQFVERPLEIDCPEHGVNLWLPSKSRQLWYKGYSDQEIFRLLYNATRNVGHRTVTEAEIKRAIALVIGTPSDSLHIAIATVNNPAMIELKKLSPKFEAANPNIKLN